MDESREEARLRAQDLMDHLERMLPHIRSDVEAFKEWQAAVEAAKALIHISISD
jgi:hypothetical protein